MSFTKRIGILCFVFFSGTCWGQDDLLGLLQPRISVNYLLSPHYAHNFSFAQRVLFLNPMDSGIETIHLDLAHFSNFILPRQRSIGLGIMYRLREPFEGPDQNELRLTQQLNLIHSKHSIRTSISHGATYFSLPHCASFQIPFFSRRTGSREKTRPRRTLLGG